MENQAKAPSVAPQPDTTLENQVAQMSLGDAAVADTPETVRFRSLPQEVQRRILKYPQILATSMHLYSQGEDCESILMHTFENTAEMLRSRNTEGDNPLAVSLLRNQDQRAEKLMELADRKNPAALDDRTRFHETLLMLSTSSSSAGRLVERLLMREPTQLHRLYDDDGRNFLHHCAMEQSVDTLDAALRVTRQLIEENRIQAAQVSAALHMNDRTGDTLMHMMASHNRPDMLRLLVEFANEVGINLNLDERQHTMCHWTPMMSGVNAGAVDAVAFLLDNGADPTEEDSDGRTVIDMAAENDRLMELFRDSHDDETHDEVAAAPATAGIAAASAASADGVTWIQKGQSVPTVDSGTGTCGDSSFLQPAEGAVASVDASAADVALSSSEMKRVERTLRSAGKQDAFLDAFKASHQSNVMLARMTEEPVVSLLSNLAYERHCRQLVRDALRLVGEHDLCSACDAARSSSSDSCLHALCPNLV